MRFTSAFLSLAVLGSALAAPGAINNDGLVQRDTAVALVPDYTDSLDLENSSCHVFDCLSIILVAGKIIKAITDESLTEALAAVSGNASKLCNCSACITPLGKFLEKEGICPS